MWRFLGVCLGSKGSERASEKERKSERASERESARARETINESERARVRKRDKRTET